MDVFDVLLQAGLITTAIVAYLLVFRKETKNRNYKEPGWNYPLKLLYARYVVYRWKRKLRKTEANEWPNQVPVHNYEGWDSVSVRSTAPNGTTVLLGVRMLYGRQLLSEITVHVKLSDGTSYVLPQHPDSTVASWQYYQHGWSASGLKFHVLEAQKSMRITYNGLLTRDDGTTQHVRLNLIWTAATPVVRHPDDWSSELAAEALAHEPWSDTDLFHILSKNSDSGWMQFGSMQGRFESYNEEGATDTSVYLQTRGLKERSWSLQGYKEKRRSVRLTAASVDGTLIHLRCLSFNNAFTRCVSGAIRFPNFSVESITSTDLALSNFCETPHEIPKVYSINVSSKTRDFKVMLRVNSDGGRAPSGVPYQHELHYRTLIADIDGFTGSGILELGYKPQVTKEPKIIILNPPRVLKYISKLEAGHVSYCVSFADRRAACADLVGGKGASLALLASMQEEEGYKVPSGFCLTTNALNKYLELNPAIKDAILEIEAANENYEERIFKQKCGAASALFAKTEISQDVRYEILANITELRTKAAEQNLGPELRFAVRSSAVGEDSEVLSAAGQNETILGCVSDADILNGIAKCWGSMFAFTSAYYRRQNGQPCLCGGGVVVQTLVSPRAAGVMFTRHPEHGDPTRLLITANFGLGESVVSGTVEPDTFIIKRNKDNLSISQTILGSKTQRVTVKDNGVGIEAVPASESETACLSEREVLRLAQLGVRQEALWMAPRDIEWAIAGNDLYLLQARPITSLERWTEEELLHELDCPIMADDELISFGNTGEVLPRPLTPMTHDIMKDPLTKGMDSIVGKGLDAYNPSVVTTHHRCALELFNAIYEKVSNEIDINIRMIEMAIHGHNVADDDILSSAIHRRPPKKLDRVIMIWRLIKSLVRSKRCMNQAIKHAKAMDIDDSGDPAAILQALADSTSAMYTITFHHGMTSMASTGTQFIAMSVLLEGRSEFSPEICNEISALLSSGDVLSAEVPQGLASLARKLEASGQYERFRAIDPKDGMQWLKDNLPEVYSDVGKFLEQHGHRAIMEFDLLTKPWVLVPEEMMKVLQNLRSTAETKPHSKTDAEIIASLKSPQKDSTRKVLGWVMPLCRRTVRHREGSKAHLILAVHKLRLACLRLGTELVKRWYLPNVDLVFFFRFKELQDYIQTRDPALLRKAIQRQQYYPGWCKLKFAEMNRGWPAPLAPRLPSVSAGDVRIEAATVCGGVVVARACVVKDLSEIDQLQQGDILITHATDIGWSPYFPLLSGIVTELGGLISHGAVIAREYGLPCLVGAADATDIFKTGDMVRLSGTDGTLERVILEKPEQNDTQ